MVNEKFLEFIIQQAKAKLISDIALGLWMELLTNFDIYQDSK
jgi:hypothetical protein